MTAKPMASPSSFRRSKLDLKRLGRRLLQQPFAPSEKTSSCPSSSSVSSFLWCQDLMDIQQNCTELGVELTHKCGETLLDTSRSMQSRDEDDDDDDHMGRDPRAKVGIDYKRIMDLSEVRRKERALQHHNATGAALDNRIMEPYESKRTAVVQENHVNIDAAANITLIQEELDNLKELMITAQQQEQQLRDLMVISDDEEAKRSRKGKKQSSKTTVATKKPKEGADYDVLVTDKSAEIPLVTKQRKISTSSSSKATNTARKETEMRVTGVTPKEKSKERARSKTPSKRTHESNARHVDPTSQTFNDASIKEHKAQLIAKDDLGHQVMTDNQKKSSEEMKHYVQQALIDKHSMPVSLGKQTKAKTDRAKKQKNAAAVEARKQRMNDILAMQEGRTSNTPATPNREKRTLRGIEPPAMLRGKEPMAMQDSNIVKVKKYHTTNIEETTKRPDAPESSKAVFDPKDDKQNKEASSRSRSTIASTGEEHLKELTKRIAEASKAIRKDAAGMAANSPIVKHPSHSGSTDRNRPHVM